MYSLSNRIRRKTQQGFSLLEFSLVLVLVGILLGSVLLLYNGYTKTKAIKHDQEAAEVINQTVASFFRSRGRFPCPSSISAGEGSPLFGRETDCSDTSVAPGTCGPHYCVAARTFDDDGDPATPDVTRRVRIGSVPFLDITDMNGFDDNGDGIVSEDEFSRYIPGEFYSLWRENAVDSHGRRFTYAVTENQAVNGAFVEGAGGILIQTEQVPPVVLNNTANYVVIGYGEDGFGARNENGTAFVGCLNAPSAAETENCDNDAVFVSGLIRTTAGANYFDDSVSYRVWMPWFLWDVEPETVGGNDLLNSYNRYLGYVGIGTETPQARVHVVNGNVYATNFWVPLFSGWGPADVDNDSLEGLGKISSNQLCSANGECFNTELIAGDVFPQCPNGFLMDGIENSAPVCVQSLPASASATCEGDSFYLQAIRYSPSQRRGEIKCFNPLTGEEQIKGFGNDPIQPDPAAQPGVQNPNPPTSITYSCPFGTNQLLLENNRVICLHDATTVATLTCPNGMIGSPQPNGTLVCTGN